MWHLPEMRFQMGGPLILPRSAAPLGLPLHYQRALGVMPPAGIPGLLDSVVRDGWRIEFGRDSGETVAGENARQGLGDFLMRLSAVRALRDACVASGSTPPSLMYRGPNADLMARCELAFDTTEAAGGPHFVWTRENGRDTGVHILLRLHCQPVWHFAGMPLPIGQDTVMPAWLDSAGEQVELHAAFTMRYYLEFE
jgi:hypothetical protein